MKKSIKNQYKEMHLNGHTNIALLFNHNKSIDKSRSIYGWI